MLAAEITSAIIFEVEAIDPTDSLISEAVLDTTSVSSVLCLTCSNALSVCCVVTLVKLEIFSAASDERPASVRTSSATTANPRPCSPALAASIAAFKASRLVCSAILYTCETNELISDADCDNCSNDVFKRVDCSVKPHKT